MIPSRDAVDGFMIATSLLVPFVTCLGLGLSRRFRFGFRVASVAVFQLGCVGVILWLLTRFGWSQTWEAARHVRQVNVVGGWVLNILFYICLASPLLSLGFLWDCFRYSRGLAVAPFGLRIYVVKPIYRKGVV